MTSIFITSSLLSDTKRIYANQVQIGGRRLVDAKPNPNGEEIVEVHTQSIENPKIVISGVNIVDNLDDTLNYTDIYKLLKHNYDGTNQVKLFIEYGNNKTVPSFSEETTGIPVILEQFSVVLSTADSRDAYMPKVNLTFMETK